MYFTLDLTCIIIDVGLDILYVSDLLQTMTKFFCFCKHSVNIAVWEKKLIV